MVFQEQVMRILNLLGRISLADAYSCIKRSVKKARDDRQFRERSSRGAREKGLEKKRLRSCSVRSKSFAGYALTSRTVPRTP